jgi:hypothetical protein
MGLANNGRHMEKTQDALKQLNAKRKLRVSANCSGENPIDYQHIGLLLLKFNID